MTCPQIVIAEMRVDVIIVYGMINKPDRVYYSSYSLECVYINTVSIEAILAFVMRVRSCVLIELISWPSRLIML